MGVAAQARAPCRAASSTASTSSGAASGTVSSVSPLYGLRTATVWRPAGAGASISICMRVPPAPGPRALSRGHIQYTSDQCTAPEHDTSCALERALRQTIHELPLENQEDDDHRQ